MVTKNYPRLSAELILVCLTMGAVSHRGFAEITLTPWGNVAGMRVDGQPIEFEAGLRIVRSDWRGFSAAVKYLQRPRYSRAGAQRIVESEIEGLAFREMVRDTGPGEAIRFSFNEPETGVEVRQTPAERARFNRAMGVHLAKCGLATRMLLGDTAHCTMAALDFLAPSLSESAVSQYVGALGFHTWRGCTEKGLLRWADAARQLNVPLLVTEAGPDAHLHEYPQVMLEPWFQLQEIELYLRICALGQPATIMEWQLTIDYSVLWGGGVYGSEGPLRPTQRFWNLKQLGFTPPGAFALPIVADRSDVTCAAFGDLANGHYVVHIVNRGAQRPAMLTGLPESVIASRRLVTDADHGMEENARVSVQAGKAEFALPPASYTTLLNTNTP